MAKVGTISTLSFSRVTSALVALGVVAGTISAADAKGPLRDPQAEAHFEVAQKFFDKDDYASAIPELKAAYSIEPNPQLLYAWAQAVRLSGDCAKALGLYQRFLETKPSPEFVRVTETNMLDCSAAVPAEPNPEPEPEPEPESAARVDEPTDLGPHSGVRSPRADWVWPSLVGVGTVAAAGGAVFVGLAYRQSRAAGDAATEQDYFDELDAGQQKHTIGAVLLGVGTVAIVGGLVRYWVLRSRYERAQRSPVARVAVGAFVPSKGMGLSMGGRF